MIKKKGNYKSILEDNNVELWSCDWHSRNMQLLIIWIKNAITNTFWPGKIKINVNIKSKIVFS